MEDIEWVPIRRVCEDLGISQEMQHTRVKNDARFEDTIREIKSKDGRMRKMRCIPANQVDLFKSTINPNNTNKTKQLYVYFIQIIPDGPIKIGLSNNPKQRLRLLSTAFPYELDLLGFIEGDYNLEKELHQKFKEDHIRGEWFNPTKTLLAEIRKLLKPNKRKDIKCQMN